jgi:tetratricopeptide (TPR) repeat protein/predicted Ser/Thr protein kinase
LQQLFESVIRLEPASRSAFLDRACGDDAELRRRIDQIVCLAEGAGGGTVDLLDDDRIELLRASLEQALDAGSKNALPDINPMHTRAGSAAGSLKSVVGQDLPFREIEGFQIRRRVASGGMGTVYEAEQQQPRRTVALKMLHTHRVTPALVSRLQRESEILGRLQHPGIAQVYDAGLVPSLTDGPGGDGTQPYFAMEYIDGVTLTKHADSAALDDHQRLELLAAVCDAVQYAHEKGVVHRDLKPGNILVDQRGHPKVLDFGIARVTDDAAGAVTVTQDGQLLGTLAYMAPEQMSESSSTDVTPRADVYSLGVIGFELLAGRLPHDLAGKSTAASLKWLSQNDPPKLGTIERRFRGDAQTIIHKALERDPQRRYASAAALAADIRSYLAHQPIAARPPSLAYVATRFTRRHRVLVAAVIAVFTALVSGIVVAESSRAKTQAALDELEQVAAYQETQLSGIDPAMFGIRMRETLLTERRAGMELAGKDEDDIVAAVADLEQAFYGLNFTNASLTVLDENIFERSLESIDEQFADQPLVRARLLHALGKTMIDVGLLGRSTAPLAEALRIRREMLGDLHLDTLESLSTPLHRDHLTTLSNVRLAAEGTSTLLGAHDPLTLSRRMILAYYLFAAYEHDEAITLGTEVFETSQFVLGHDHQTTLECKLKLAWILKSSELGTAARLASEAYADALRLGIHEELARSRLNSMLFTQGKYDEVIPYYREWLSESREKFGTRHIITIGAADDLGVNLEMSGRLDEAESVLSQAVRWAQAASQIHAPNCFHNLGVVQYKQGRLHEAETNIRESLRSEQAINGGALVSAGKTGSLAMVLTDLGQLDEAEEHARKAIELAIDNTGGEDTWLTAHVRGLLARILGKKGQFDEAENEMLRAHRGLLKHLRKEHDRTQLVVGYLIELYDAWHDTAAQHGYDERAAEWREVLEESQAEEGE